MQTLILASGYNPEWIWPHYTKHTVPIADIPLIVRTIQQLGNPIVITQRKEIENLVPPNCGFLKGLEESDYLYITGLKR